MPGKTPGAEEERPAPGGPGVSIKDPGGDGSHPGLFLLHRWLACVPNKATKEQGPVVEKSLSENLLYTHVSKERKSLGSPWLRFIHRDRACDTIGLHNQLFAQMYKQHQPTPCPWRDLDQYQQQEKEEKGKEKVHRAYLL